MKQKQLLIIIIALLFLSVGEISHADTAKLSSGLDCFNPTNCVDNCESGKYIEINGNYNCSTAASATSYIPPQPKIVSGLECSSPAECIRTCESGKYRTISDSTMSGHKSYMCSNQSDAIVPAPTIGTSLPPYKLLESFPGFFAAGSSAPDLPVMILAIYKFGIWTVGIAGLFMLVIGGFMYMTSAGNTASVSSAKKIIWDSLLGIVAALGAYLVMYVINPDLTKINIAFTPVTVTSGAVTGAVPGAALPAGTLTDAAAKAALGAVGIGVKDNVCAQVTDSGCTTLEGIPSSAIDNLIKLKNACGSSCNVFVSGGTEGGHSSHGPGKPRLDVRTDPALKSFLLQQKSSANLGSFGITQICATDADADLRYNCSTVETAPHYHLSFGS